MNKQTINRIRRVAMKNAWNSFRVYQKHQIKKKFGDIFRLQYRIAKMIIKDDPEYVFYTDPGFDAEATMKKYSI